MARKKKEDVKEIAEETQMASVRPIGCAKPPYYTYSMPNINKAQQICDAVWANQSPDVPYNERVRRCKAAAQAQDCPPEEIEAVEFG